MDWIERFTNSLNYIENNIDESLEFDVIASRANTTSFHFQRMFSMLSGITLGEYIRRRRLTLAAKMLAESDVRILDVAVKYGYESQASFTKAFGKMHGFPPGAIRDQNNKAKAFPPLSLKLIIEGDESMDYMIKEIGPIRLIGKTIRVTTKDGQNKKMIPAFWEQSDKNKSLDTICSVVNKQGILQGAITGVCMDFAKDQEKFTYMIGAESDIETIPEGFEERLIQKQNWAIFSGRGAMPKAIQDVWKKIFQEWFPATGFEHAGGPELEVYPEEDCDKDNTPFQIWIPVIKK